MAILTVLQKEAINRAIESAEYLADGISAGGKCELDKEAYDYASLRILEIKHWLQAVIKDSETLEK